MNDQLDNFWQLPKSARMHPRLAAEMVLDAFEYEEEPKGLINELRNRGFDADMLRVKGYINHAQGYIVCVLPMCSHDMQSVASISLRKNIANSEDTYVPAGATIVKTSQAVNPEEFTVITYEKGRLKESKPGSFEALKKQGARGVFKEMYGRTKLDRFERMSKGRALAGVVLKDFAVDEYNLGFISKGEFNKMMGDSDLYSEISRIHSYVGAVAAKGGGCSLCCSSSCYACSSCSCNFGVAVEVQEPVQQTLKPQ